MDVRGRVPSVAVRGLLGRPTRRPGEGGDADPPGPGSPAHHHGAWAGSPSLVRRVAGPSGGRRVLGRPPAGPVPDPRPGVLGAGLVRRLILAHGPRRRGP